MKQNKLECQHLRLRSNTPAVFERWEESAGDTFCNVSAVHIKKGVYLSTIFLKTF